METCVDCGLPAVRSGRCEDCATEVAETPEWAPQQAKSRRRRTLPERVGTCAHPECGQAFRCLSPLAQYCSQRCKYLAARAREEADGRLSAAGERRRAATAVRNARQLCARCQTEFGSHNRRKYCSEQCGRAAARARARGRGGCSASACDRGVLARGLCSTHYNATYFPDSHKRWPGNPDLRRASLRRKTQRRRAVERGLEAETVDRDKVGHRDRWRCFCGQKIDRRLAWPHPRSASLDHIIPISQDGPHTYANCRIAHLDCNLRRGNRGRNDQLALIG